MKVKTYKFTSNLNGDREMEECIERFLTAGWEVLSHTTRKQMWNPLVGIFTSNQVHTVTFVFRTDWSGCDVTDVIPAIPGVAGRPIGGARMRSTFTAVEGKGY